LLKEDENGILIRIEVVVNFELEREILGFGGCIKVLAPHTLAARIRTRLSKAMEGYDGKVEKLKS
jgi:predicted DNA-binding transcriptional regulator YafY